MTVEELKVFQKYDWYQVDMDRCGKEPHQYDGKSIPFIECYVSGIPLDEDYLSLNNINFERVDNLDKDKELGFTYTKHLWGEGYLNYLGYEERTIKINIPNTNGKIKCIHELQHILRDKGMIELANNFKTEKNKKKYGNNRM